VLRIFPCFYTYFAVVSLLAIYGPYQISNSMLVAAGTFTLNYRHLWDQCSAHATDYYVIGQYWTLALEEQFYLTWPLLMILIRKKCIQGALIAAILAAPLIRVLTYFAWPESRGQLIMMAHTGYDAIGVGVLLGDLMQRPRSSSLLIKAASRRWTYGLALAVMLFVSPCLASVFGGAYSVTIGATVDLIAISMLLVAAVHYKESVLFAVLNWRQLAFVGTLSYSLYIWNPLFLYEKSPAPVTPAPLAFLLVFVAAFAPPSAIETPFLRLKDRMVKNSSKTRAKSPVTEVHTGQRRRPRGRLTFTNLRQTTLMANSLLPLNTVLHRLL